MKIQHVILGAVGALLVLLFTSELFAADLSASVSVQPVKTLDARIEAAAERVCYKAAVQDGSTTGIGGLLYHACVVNTVAATKEQLLKQSQANVAKR